MAETQPIDLQELCYTASEDRQVLGSLVCESGVRDITGQFVANGDLFVESTGAADHSVEVNTGQAFIWAPDGGMYWVKNDDTIPEVSKQLSAGGGGNPRIDMIVATVRDSEYGGGDDDWIIDVVEGTPTAGAQVIDPQAANYHAGLGSLPDYSIVLAYVRVPAADTLTTTIADVDVEDGRSEYVACGDPLVSVTRFSRTANQSLTNGTETVVTWTAGSTGTPVPNAYYDETSGTFTFYKDGVYLFMVEAEFTEHADSNRRQLLIYQTTGGVTSIAAAVSAAAVNSASIKTIVRLPAIIVLNAGDTVQVKAQQDSSVTLNVTGASCRVARMGTMAL